VCGFVGGSGHSVPAAARCVWQVRERRNLSQAALAERIAVSREYIARLEMGKHEPPLSRVDSEAVEWRRRAAEQGYASAQPSLGFKYRIGQGV